MTKIVLLAKNKIENVYEKIYGKELLNSVFCNQIAFMKNTSTFQVYSASAGSGKTFSLVKEYLKIVVSNPSPDYFQHILAITFTNKAANEMKERIVKNLRQFSLAEVLTNPTDMFLKVVEEANLKPEIIQKRAKLILEQILTKYGSFSISTIDSFTHKIIRNFAFDLGLPINFEVELKSKNLLDLAVDKLIAQIGVNEEITDFLIEYALQNIEEDKSWDFTNTLREHASVLLQETDRLHYLTTANFSLNQFKELSKKLLKHRIQLEKEFKVIGETSLNFLKDKNIENNFYKSYLPKYYEKFINFKEQHDKISFETELDKKMALRELYSKATDLSKKAIIDTFAEEICAHYESSKSYFLENYPSYLLAEMVSSKIAAHAVLNHLNKALQELKKDKNLLLSAEFNQLISDEIKNQPAPFIYEKLGTKYHHYFIDEMQDTSALQWENLVPLIENALSQEGGSLLLVGDAKQSIYRWRGGKTEQFISLSNYGKSKENNPFYLEKEVKNLDTNYRSYQTIIDFNNSFFTHIAKYFENELHQQLFLDTIKQKVTTDKNGGYVQVSFVEKQQDDADNIQPYLTKIESILANLDENFNKNDVCILVRKNKEGVAVANYLIEKNIQVVSSESLLLANNEKVAFIINLLTYLLKPTDELVKFNCVSFLHKKLNIEIQFHDFMSQFVKKDSQQVFKLLKSYLVDFNSSLFFQKNLYDAIEYIIQVFNLTETSNAYIQYFLDFVLDFQSKEHNSLSGFLDEWELQKENLSIIAPENNNAVRIMTIHKAKGLEFPIVIFPFDLEIKRELKGQTWISLAGDDLYDGLETMKINVSQKLEKLGTQGADLYTQRQEELLLDNFNLLYVVLTRAIEQLYIISEKKNSENLRWYSDLFVSFLADKSTENSDLYEFGNPTRVSKVDEKSKEGEMQTIQQLNFISTSLTNTKISIVTNESKWWGTALQEATNYGNKIHQLLAQIETINDIEDTINTARQNGLIAQSEAEMLVKIIEDIVYHPKLKSYYQPNLLIYNEREILTNTSEIIVPDRLVINKNEAVIIDYKTGKPMQEHEKQVNKYGLYVRELGYEVKFKFLVYINEKIEVKEVV